MPLPEPRPEYLMYYSSEWVSSFHCTKFDATSLTLNTARLSSSATFGSVRGCWRHSERALSVIADQKDTVGTDIGWDRYERDIFIRYQYGITN